MENNDELDSVYASDRNHGSPPPEPGELGSNVVGRPHSGAGFAEPDETVADEREAMTDAEAYDAGGSFDGLGVPVADDTIA